ncbi:MULTISPECIES: hypothetical protein [unclassified Acinetobacter]|uniref:hypothetical protein n=1 Tax=unclassified Acinetobacter TaxID=196816 RepID=UPI0035BA6CDC
MKNFKLLLTATLLSLSLTGCMTKLAERIDVSTSKQPIESPNLILSDKVIALGKSRQFITSHPDALVMVGEKQSYLIEPYQRSWRNMTYKKPNDWFTQIYNKVDLNYMSVALDYDLRYADKAKKSHVMELVIDNPDDMNTAKTWLNLSFNKPLSSVTSSEKSTLSELGFLCTEKSNFYSCSSSVIAKVTVNQAIPKAQAFAHLLQKPFDVELYFPYYVEQDAKAPQALKVLKPLALVIDVITAPIRIGGQLIGNMGPTGD